MAEQSSIFDAQTPQDLVKGWNEKRQSNNEIISGLTPFVQLIGVFNDDEYEKMLSSDHMLHKREVWYVEKDVDNIEGNDIETEISLDTKAPNDQVRDLHAEFESKIQNRFFNLYIGGDSDNTLNQTPESGIMMAETVSQSKNHKGGVGVTDLQIDYGKHGVLGSRTYTIRITVNDPTVLNERPEYSKLATQFGEFVILYGWSNPTSVPGYDATPPPHLMIDPKNISVTDENGITRLKQMMIIPINNIDSGGYWSAAKVHISKYDFSFNEVGQLEITAVLRDMTSIHLTTTKVSTIAPLFKKLMATADYDPTAKVSGTPTVDLLSLTVSNLDGDIVTVPQNIMLEQSRMAVNNPNAPEGIVSPYVMSETNASLSDRIDALEVDSSSYNADFSYKTVLADRQKTESLGFPHAVGVATYEETLTRKLVIDEETSLETIEERSNYKVKTVYYYMGWILEGIRLCLSDANRTRAAAGHSIFNPQFFYLGNEDTSTINTAFQSQINRANRSNSMDERVQEAIIRLKEYCLPPNPPMRELEVSNEDPQNIANQEWDTYIQHGEERPNYVFKSKKIEPCTNKLEYRGEQNTSRESALNDAGINMPTDYREKNTFRALATRGFLHTGVPSSLTDEQKKNIKDAFGDDDDDLVYFVPDWPEVTELDSAGETISLGGNKEGFRPDNPTAYMAADRGGKFYYKITYTYKSYNSDDEKEFVEIIEVDTYRTQDPEIWNATQLAWMNYYRRYLSTYFESIIKQRISQLAIEGRTVEDIYDEPIDLDYLTSLVYRNENFQKKNKNRKVIAESSLVLDKDMQEKISDQIDDNLSIEVLRLGNRLNTVSEKIKSVRMEGYGQPQGDGTMNNGGESYWLRYKNKLEVINNKKIEIEDLTGGIYERVINSAGLEELKNFRNYAGVLQGPRTYEVVKYTEEERAAKDPREVGYIIGQERPVQRKWEVIYGPYGEGPVFSEEYWLWKKAPGGSGEVEEGGSWFPDFEYRAPTGMDIEDVPEQDLVPIERFRFIKNSERSYYVYTQEQSFVREHFHLAAFHGPVELAMYAAEARVNTLISEVANLESDEDLTTLKILVERVNNTTKILENEKNSISVEIANLQKYMESSEEDVPFSLYDTDSVNSAILVEMGRVQNKCILETLTAQKFKKVFDTFYYPQKGVNDIQNYGPALGGTQYYYPSNIRKFLFDKRKFNKPIVGDSRVIFDPMAVEALGVDENGISYAQRLDAGAEKTYGGLEYDPYRVINGVVGDTVTYDDRNKYINWGMFGTPDLNQNDPNLNDYGFIPSPRVLDENGFKIGGGDYVANYGEFLNIFGLVQKPHLPGIAKIIGIWPRPTPGWHMQPSSAEDGDEEVMPYFYMIDDENNVIMPNYGDDVERAPFVQTGWWLGYGGPPVYLYPDRAHAVKVDPSKEPGTDQWVIESGLGGIDGPNEWANYKGDGTINFDTSDGSHGTPLNYASSDNDKNGNRQEFQLANSEDIRDRSGHDDDGTGDLRRGSHTELQKAASIRAPVPAGAVIRTDGTVYLDDNNGEGYYGLRIGRGEHNIQLTLDQKRALVIPRGAVHKGDLLTLGNELPAEQGEKESSIRKRQAEADAGVDEENLPAPKYKQGNYSNVDYPFGSGLYEAPNEAIYGSRQSPQRNENKNYLYIGDFLKILPGKGFFTKVNNNNNSPTTIKPDGTIVNGAELNMGVVKFIIQNVLAPIGQNRRTATRNWGHFHTPRGPIEIANEGRVPGVDDKYRVVDTTYRHLFSPEEEDKSTDPEPAGPSFANLTNLSIDNVADIPIRRDVVDNLMTKNNTNMSLAQFIQEITKPAAVGVNTGSMHIGFRQRADNVFEVFQASKNWQDTARTMYENYNISLLTNRYPNRHLLFDYKANDSLIENIDMNSKFDPAVALTFKRGSLDFTQNSEKFAKFLAYGNVAPDLKQFLSEYDAGSNTQYAQAITVYGQENDQHTDWEGRVVIEKNAFTGDNRIIPQNVISQFLMQKPERVARLNTFLQSQAGGNFTTQLMANYMRQSTITIHGTVNIVPFNTIHIRGVLPDLEGIYLVTNTRDSITPQGFNTVINAVLIEPLNALENNNG